MSVQILYDNRNDVACLTCSTSDVAFGPLFNNTDTHDADERAESFMRWMTTADCSTFERSINTGRNDPREFTESGLMAAYAAWLAQERQQWAAEDAPDCDECGEKMTWTATAPVHDSPMRYRCFSHQCMVREAASHQVSTNASEVNTK